MSREHMELLTRWLRMGFEYLTWAFALIFAWVMFRSGWGPLLSRGVPGFILGMFILDTHLYSLRKAKEKIRRG